MANTDQIGQSYIERCSVVSIEMKTTKGSLDMFFLPSSDSQPTIRLFLESPWIL